MAWARRSAVGWVEDVPPDDYEADDGKTWDLRGRDRDTMAYCGWQQVVESERPPDTATTTWDRTVELVRSRVTVVWVERPWTAAELAARQEKAVALANLEERIAALEARVGVIEPTPPTGAEPTFAELTGRQGGAVYAGQRFRWTDSNVWAANSGPLNSQATPATYPSGYTQLTGLPETVGPWVAGETVAAGDLREYAGTVYRCVQGHTTQTGWEPPAVPALWTPA